MTENEWAKPWFHEAERDPLLGALTWLIHHHGKHFAPEQLINGLPLEKGKLTPPLAVRAAKRVGCEAKWIERSLEAIPPFLFPCIALTKKKQACIILSIQDPNIEILWPELNTPISVSLTEFSEVFAGVMLLIKPIEKLPKGPAFREKVSEYWLEGVFHAALPVYSEVLLASLFINVFTIFSTLYTMNVYDRVVPNAALETLWVLTIGMAIVYLFDSALKLLRAHFVDVAARRADVVMSSRIHEKLLGLKMSERPESVGSLANTVNQFDAFREFFASVTLLTIIDMPFAILFLMVIAWIGGAVVWVPLLAFPLVIGVVFWVQKPLYGAIKASYRFSGIKYTVLLENLAGAETLKTLNAEWVRQRQWEELIVQASGLNEKSKMWSTFALQYTQFVQQIAQMAVVVVGVYCITENLMTMGALIASTLLTSRALAPLAQLASLLTRYQQAISSFTGVKEIMHKNSESHDMPLLSAATRLKGAIDVQNLTFSYGKDEPVLKKITFSVSPGEKVAILGKIGSGKSTLEKLFLKLYDFQEGKLLLDGTDIRQLDPSYVRANIGYCPQDLFLINGDIKQNILLGTKQIQQDLLIRATYFAGVSEFVLQHPEGYSRQVGERGQKLSGGQRQAIVLARALLQDPALFVLDEPTSMMDVGTELRVLKRLKVAFQHKTVLLITHKTSLLDLVDRIIILDKGSIIADGPRDTVLEQLRSGQIQPPTGDNT